MSTVNKMIEKYTLSPVSDDEASDTDFEYNTLPCSSHERGISTIPLGTLQLPTPPPIDEVNKNWALGSFQYGVNNTMSTSAFMMTHNENSSTPFFCQSAISSEGTLNTHILKLETSCGNDSIEFTARQQSTVPLYKKETGIVVDSAPFSQGGNISDLKHNNNRPTQSFSNRSYSAATLEWLNGNSNIDKGTVIESHINLFPENEIRQHLISLQITQPAIDEASEFMSKFINPPGPLFQIMAEEYCKNESPTHCLAIFYLFNHLIQNYQNIVQRNQNGQSFADIGYKRFLQVVASKIASQADNRKYMRCVKIWQDRGIYSKPTCEKLRFILSTASNCYASRVGDLVGANANISNSLGKLSTLTYVLEMPSSGKACQNAKKLFPELINTESRLDHETLAETSGSILETASKRFDRASRITGQEIILLQSLLLDLGALVEDNHNAILNIKKMFENKLSGG